jgi:hypothetical protein
MSTVETERLAERRDAHFTADRGLATMAETQPRGERNVRYGTAYYTADQVEFMKYF